MQFIMKDIIKLFSIFTPKQLRECYLIFIAMLFGAMLESIGIGAIFPLITLMTENDFFVMYPEIAVNIKSFGIKTNGEFLIAVACFVILLFIFKGIYLSAEIGLQRYFSYKYQALFSKALFEEYLKKPYLYHINKNTATLLRNVNNGAFVIFVQMLMPAFTILTEIFTMLAIAVTILLVDTHTAVLSAALIGMMILFVTKLLRPFMIKQGKSQNMASKEYIKWMNQGLGAIKETKIMHKERFFIDEFNKNYKQYAEAVQKFSYFNDIPRIIIESLVITILLSVVIVKICFGEDASTIVPILGVWAFAAFRLMPSANRIVSYMNAIKNQMPFLEEIYPDLMMIKKRQICKNIEDLTCREKMLFKSSLKMDNVFFKYPDGENYILNGVSFQIRKGDFVGIVGSSGSGKTTCVDLLLGLLRPEKGQILCDDKSIEFNIQAWQSNLAYVPQDIYLIDGTIRENIALGESIDTVDNDLLEKVLHMAELHKHVLDMPKGVDTFVGERGVKLSGGQRQRIGIARALYQQPEVLVLDEATSALDNDTEKSITNTILKLKGQITIIAIAHRVSTLEQCDYKLKFEKGKVTTLYK